MKKIYAVGDVQGCFSELETLIRIIGRDNIDELWLTGDLVNRGLQSLETLRWCVSNQHWVKVVLGNHDLHLLAVAAGIRTQKPGDTLDSILNAPDSAQLLQWLRNQPLAQCNNQYLMVHAGVLPSWSRSCTLELSNEVSGSLKSDDWKQFLATMYGNTPIAWHPALRGPDRARVIINAMTRLRYCTVEGAMEFETKEGLNSAPSGYLPWFDVPNRATENIQIVFGHWSTLGLLMRDNIKGIDTGCVWGGDLTALRLDNSKVIQTPRQKR
jgi:bis(5'-nucleosyl)-tetraphosphatase (symmetrical)